MSPRRRPAAPPIPPAPPASLSVAEIKQIGDFFKEWFEGTNLKWWIIAAGVGAVVDALHVGWLALIWVFGRMR